MLYSVYNRFVLKEATSEVFSRSDCANTQHLNARMNNRKYKEAYGNGNFGDIYYSSLR